MRVHINQARDRVIIRGDVSVARGQQGVPGWYEIRLTWTQALGLAATLERLAKLIEPVLGEGRTAEPHVEPDPLQIVHFTQTIQAADGD